jgi:hypothetical protein
MRSLSARELVELWEHGLGQDPVERALSLLAACSSDEREALARLSLGRRDARLLEVHERLFGPMLDAFAECPRCAERLEYSLSTRELLAPAEAPEGPELTLQVGDLALRLRLPDSLDLGAARACVDPEAARRLLLERCVLEAVGPDGAAVPPRSLPEATIAMVANRLAEADPQAEMQIDLTCSNCRHRWQVLLEIESFLWAKIHALARRLLGEVHLLAQAYGWSEGEILALGARRRQAYLDLIGA